MDVERWLGRIQREKWYRGQIVHIERMPARPARFGEPQQPLPPPLRTALASFGIERLYVHQVEALNTLRQGLPLFGDDGLSSARSTPHSENPKSIVVVTGTASGKTLCYQLPILEQWLNDRTATALLLYPTKALAQDQLRSLERFQQLGKPFTFVAGTYDGDTPADLRRKLRDHAHLLLTNPDMLHQGILPHHGKWGRFFSKLKYVVLDELHTYRGVFGSHVANVMRRLRRLAAHYGANPTFCCSSATIANPKWLAEQITGVPMRLIDEDGSPRGPKTFVFWNPPLLDGTLTDRISPISETARLMSDLIENKVQTIAFTTTRLSAELILRSVRHRLRSLGPRWQRAVAAYRAGYLPEERREIERKLAAGELLGVASTNALELGIDIGTLDASLLVGYPGTIASLLQQAGRAGRREGEALVVLLARNLPIDQYLMNKPAHILGRSPENAVIDRDNAFVVHGHLLSAAYELALRRDEIGEFGPYAGELLALSAEAEFVKELRGRIYHAHTSFPAADVNLRAASPIIYTIVDATDETRVIGTMDETSAFTQLHTHAVYLHGAETYFVNELDIEKKIARVEQRETDYYTQAVTASKLVLDRPDEDKPEKCRWRECDIGHGDVTVTTTVPMFKKVKFYSRESIGFEELELPPQTLETTAMWLAPPKEVLERVRARGLVAGEGLVGIANLMVEVAPLFIMCDPSDIGVVTDASNLGREAIFLYDRHQGGMGFSARAKELVGEILRAALDVVQKCACEDGCPSCVGAPMPRFAMTDLDSGTRGRIPDKQAALLILRDLLGESTGE
ncbi:MAG: DEAD/DEAH box helicase [Candidatus Sumerlaeia bacterium]|nr:DEAD/DEAH box helicase [Candidatus Sumerlaeia bacterium]